MAPDAYRTAPRRLQERRRRPQEVSIRFQIDLFMIFLPISASHTTKIKPPLQRELHFSSPRCRDSYFFAIWIFTMITEFGPIWVRVWLHFGIKNLPKSNQHRSRTLPRDAQSPPGRLQERQRRPRTPSVVCQEASKRSQDASRSAWDAPKKLQNASKTPPRAPKMPPRAPKTPKIDFRTSPRRLQERPRRLQEPPRRPLDASRRLQDASKTVQDGPKSAEDVPKRFPYASKSIC